MNDESDKELTLITRRSFTTRAAIGTAVGFIATQAIAQATTARILIGFAAGSNFDAFTRRVADQLRGKLAPTVIVENKPGAGGQIAMTTIRDSAADGTHILVSPSSLLTMVPFTSKSVPYKTEDFKPVAASVVLEPALAIGPAVPERVTTLRDFIQWTKENPASANYGSPAAGSMLHMIGAFISRSASANWQHVPYRGAPPAMQELLGGQIPALVLPIGEFMPAHKAGKVRVLAISSHTQSVFTPGVPTLRQLGIPLSAREWFGFYLPAASSAETLKRTAAQFQAALAQPEIASWAESVGMQMQYKNAEETAAALKLETEEWRSIVKAIGFTAES